MGHRPSLLLPFGLTEEYRIFTTYWHSILPGSKRFMTQQTSAGSNADVRPPEPAERWKGGGMGFSGLRGVDTGRQIVSAVLHLDAVFFADGECVGPDNNRLWNQIVTPSEVYRDLGVAVKARGIEAIQDFAAIASPRRPAPPPPFHGRVVDVREHERYQLSQQIREMRGHLGDWKTVAIVAEWAETPLPNYRRT